MPSRMTSRTVSLIGQRGAALMMLLLLVTVGALAFFVTSLNRATQQLERDKITAAALAQAKEALIGYAATYRDSHPGDVFGYLPLPDLGSSRNGTPEEGNASGNFAGNSTNLTVIGRLPWRALGLPPLRDGQGECLWYAVSGSFQNVKQADVLNWDSLGHFDIHSSNGTPSGTFSTTGTNYAQRPVAIIFSASAVLEGQNRQASTTDTVSSCGGNYDVRNYLDSFNSDANILSIVNYFSGSTNNSMGYAYNLTGILDGSQLNTTQLAAPKKIIFGDIAVGNAKIVNDKILIITADEIFRRIKKRSDFATQIQNLLDDPYFGTTDAYPNDASLVGPKGTGSISCESLRPLNRHFCNNWKEMLLLTKLLTPSPITGKDQDPALSCDRVLIFGGQKKGTQIRLTAADKAKPINYLEVPNFDAFATPTAVTSNFSGPKYFSGAKSSDDVIACVEAKGATQKSFTSDFGKFSPTGTLVNNVDGIQTYSTGVTANANDKTFAIGGVTGIVGGCVWYPDAVPLARTLRAYYEYQFAYADAYALTGSGSDRGNGFTFQMVRNDQGSPKTICGLTANMGALALGDPASDIWGSGSFIIETDVHEDAARSDPPANHTAIMYGGNLDHSLTNGNPTTACNGTAAGCAHSPANKFEESPSPASHSQRIQVHAGCNSSCSSCVATNTAAPKIKMMTWVDCGDCDDVAVNQLDPELIKAVQNREFGASGNWSGTNWLVMGGVLSHLTAGADAVSLPNTALYSAPVAGASYQVTVTVATTSPGKLVIAFGGASAAAIDLVAGTPKTYTVKLTAASSSPLTLTPDAAWLGSLDNVSIVAIKPDMSAELISASQDRDFSAPGSWVGANWQVTNGVLAHSLAGANAVSLPNSALISSPVAGRIYQVTVSVATSTQGKLAIAFGGATPMSIDLAAGSPATYRFLFVAATADPLSLSPDNAWVGEIDNVSITPVMTDTNAAELIKSLQNRDFSAPGNWSGTNWQVADGVLGHAVAGTNAVTLSNTWLAGAAIPGNLYQVTFTAATVAAGKLAVRFGGTSAAAIDLVAGKTATYEVLLLATSTGSLRLSPDAAWTGSVDNVSVKRLRSPIIQRCLDADTYMNSVYFGFTGGFLSGVDTRQGVTFRNFYLRSE